ncbi:MBL fold metallo-hydrolase [Chitinophaga qingshengii]|uniref:MBL fold metallo-hydrolase n=1 Tax=Chitinophaga qingshengii TaxID=1569794 RepID=A0ABR7TRI5_9BACT|nr:MBL fold metallo-hydrolase [Chitinophaga qingshengii]MBC9933098.1 MBL fold metallo-hydrolase [Chitinophaga qingshengii]
MLTTLFLILKWFFRRKGKPVVKSHTFNPGLPTIKPDWKGTPLDQNGLFIYEEQPTVNRMGDVVKFMFQRNPQRALKKADTWRITVRRNADWIDDPSDKIVWLGHASFFLQLSGISILIDPMFGKLPIVRRYSVLPVSPDKFSDINYILISHAHYDHCDKNSIKLLSKRNPQAKILAGLQLNRLISQWVKNPVLTAGWYQQYNLTNDLTITFLPTRHWANRSPFDGNTSLWGSFMIQTDAQCIYYGGDSGHGSHYKDIASLFPKVDVALIGADAYAPAWFMAQHHQDPYDAVKAFNIIGARYLIPFHYGTFDSADEPMGEPEQILKELDKKGNINGRLKILELGEVFSLEQNEP